MCNKTFNIIHYSVKQMVGNIVTHGITTVGISSFIEYATPCIFWKFLQLKFNELLHE